MTITEHAKKTGVTPDAVIKRLQRAGMGRYGVNTELTPELLTALQPKRTKTVNRSTSLPVVLAVPDTPKPQHKQVQPTIKKTPAKRFNFVTVVCVLCVVVSVALSVFGLYKLADIVGLFVGGMFGLYITFSVSVCTDNQKGDTSERSLSNVLICECLACVLHTYTIYNALTFSADIWIKTIVAAGIAALITFFSYNSVVGIRDYYAEQ